MSTTSDRRNPIEGTEKRNEYVQSLKKLIPLYKGLDKSFWDRGPFLRWQLVRLNDQYQKDVDMLWAGFRSWLNNRPNRDRTDLRDLETIQKEFPSDPEQTSFQWLEEFIFGRYYDYSDVYERHPFYDPMKDYRDIEHPVYWQSPLLNVEFNPDEDVVIAKMKTEEKHETIRIDPATLGCLDPAPIPWQIHFPHRFFLDKLPSWPEKGETLRGRPQDWALNLLVYGLSRAGAKNMEIARLLFGITKSTENYPDKHPVLVRIDMIKKTVQKAVVRAYPILHS